MLIQQSFTTERNPVFQQNNGKNKYSLFEKRMAMPIRETNQAMPINPGKEWWRRGLKRETYAELPGLTLIVIFTLHKRAICV